MFVLQCQNKGYVLYNLSGSPLIDNHLMVIGQSNISASVVEVLPIGLVLTLFSPELIIPSK